MLRVASATAESSRRFPTASPALKRRAKLICRYRGIKAPVVLNKAPKNLVSRVLMVFEK
jgi:hypothetical protein